MKLKTTLFGNVYQFKDVKEVLAKANELRSGDVLAGDQAHTLSQSRIAFDAANQVDALFVCLWLKWCNLCFFKVFCTFFDDFCFNCTQHFLRYQLYQHRTQGFRHV